MIAVLDDVAGLHHQDQVGITNCRKAMGNHETRSITTLCGRGLHCARSIRGRDAYCPRRACSQRSAWALRVLDLGVGRLKDEKLPTCASVAPSRMVLTVDIAGLGVVWIFSKLCMIRS